MYKQFFGLNENPFNVNPDPRYLYLTPQTREALDVLTYGIHARKGLMLLTGEVGTGKTTLLNRLLDSLHQQRMPTAFIFNPHLGIGHLFDFILGDFEVPLDEQLKSNPLMRLNQWLIERYRAGDIPVLIVDEAQGLSIPALEEIRMLLNLETPHEKLLQIVLAGQPEIEERLKRSELRQLKQRIMIRCKTAALTLAETHDYIRARLHIAGANGQPIFSSQAMDHVHFYSRGIPRVTNLLCEHALINAYVDQVQPVPAHIIEEVAREFQFDDISPLATTKPLKWPLEVARIAPQPALANAPALPPPQAAPFSQDKPGVMICDSPPIVVAEDLLSRATELAPSVLDAETTVELAMGKAPNSFPALADGFKAKERLDLSAVSSHGRRMGPPKTARRSTKANATGSTPLNSRWMKLLGECLLLTRLWAKWESHLFSAIHSSPWVQAIARLLSGLKPSLQTVAAMCRRTLAQGSGTQFAIGSARWLRIISVWLRKPFDPVQLLRVPYSWLFRERRKLSQTYK
jgi:general secretion pathway protein A